MLWKRYFELVVTLLILLKLYEWFSTDAISIVNKYQKYVKEDFEQPKNKKEIDSTKPLSEILEEIATSTTTTTTTSSSSSADPDQPKEKIEYLAEDNKYVRRMKNIENYCKLHYETDIGHDEVIDWVGTKTEWQTSQVDFPMIVDPQHKLMYCEMPKVGSTNWKRVLMKLTNLEKYKNVDLMDMNKVRRFQENNLTKLIDLEPKIRAEMLDNFYKFTFVRHPFERLLSGYKDKGFKQFWRNVTDKEYKEHNDEIPDFQNQDLEKFERFVDYLIARGPDAGFGGRFGVRVRHWTRYYDICHFCAVKYHFVGKIEDVNEDADYMLKDSKLDHIVQYPNFVKATSDKLVRLYFSKVPSEKIIALYNTFKVDFDLFEYSIPSYMMK